MIVQDLRFGVQGPSGGPQCFHEKSTYTDAMDFKAVCGLNLVTQHPDIELEWNFRGQPCGLGDLLEGRNLVRRGHDVSMHVLGGAG